MVHRRNKGMILNLPEAIEAQNKAFNEIADPAGIIWKAELDRAIEAGRNAFEEVARYAPFKLGVSKCPSAS